MVLSSSLLVLLSSLSFALAAPGMQASPTNGQDPVAAMPIPVSLSTSCSPGVPFANWRIKLNPIAKDKCFVLGQPFEIAWDVVQGEGSNGDPVTQPIALVLVQWDAAAQKIHAYPLDADVDPEHPDKACPMLKHVTVTLPTKDTLLGQSPETDRWGIAITGWPAEDDPIAETPSRDNIRTDGFKLADSASGCK